MRKKVNYGLDAPGLVKLFIIGGAILFVGGKILFYRSSFRELGESLFSTGPWFMASGILMIWSSYFGKFIARDKLIERLELSGAETILDLGCGRGLLLLAAAKKIPNGVAIGVDLWSDRDLSANSMDNLQSNAKLEGVADRVSVYSCDMRKLPLSDNSVDRVTASMSIHNIPSKEGRAEAIREAVRVLKPGGKIALLDFRYTAEYAKTAKEAGLINVKVSRISFWNFPPSHTVFGEKRI